MPGWLNLWFAIYPTVLSLAAQVLAAVVVLGSYFFAEKVQLRKPRKQSVSVSE